MFIEDKGVVSKAFAWRNVADSRRVGLGIGGT